MNDIYPEWDKCEKIACVILSLLFCVLFSMSEEVSISCGKTGTFSDQQMMHDVELH